MDENSKQFLDRALERELLTESQVEEAKRIYETVRDVSIEQKIEDIVVKKGFMTADVVGALRRGLSGMQVGKYKIIEKLGEGGAGIVYRATQEPLDRTVAIKVLGKHRADSSEYLERFRREARVAVTLNHQNIVRGLDFGEADGYHYFVMEYVEGESLHEVLEQEGVLEEKRSLKIVLQAIAGLRHAAEFNLVHRDIKPENILIGPDGVAKVCDLGLAKPSILETARTTKDKATIGTPVYMSPEQIRGKDDTDFRSDIYSMGVTLYEMVTGAPPFLAKTTDEIVRKHIREDPADPREKNLNVSSSLAAVILKMLAKRPEDRYASLKDLEEDLKAVLNGRPPRHTIELGGKRPSGKVRVDVDEGVSRRSRITGKKRSPVLIAVTLTVFLAAAAVAFVWKPWVPKEPGSTDPETDTAKKDGAQPGPKPEDDAEELFREAVSFEQENPEAPLESLKDRYRLVERKFPLTRYAVQAKDRLRRFEAEERSRAEKHEKDARKAYEELKSELETLVRADRHGEALAKLDTYPEEFSDTEFPRRLSPERNRIETAAQDRSNSLLSEADTKMKLGQFAEAVRILEPLAGIGIPQIEEKVRQKVGEIREAEQAESLAREQGREIFRSVVGAAYLRAAVGEYSAAEEDLIKAMDRPKLTYFRDDLESAWKDLREALGFTDALLAGASTLSDRVETFGLTSRGRVEARGKVLGATRTGIRLTRSRGEEVIRFRDMTGPELVRIGFLTLNEDQPEHHAAASLYLIVQGKMETAGREIEAARMRGADPAPLIARRELIEKYLLDRAHALTSKAEVYRQKGREGEVLDLLVEAVGLAPWDAGCRLDLGRAFLEMKRYEEAVHELKQAIALGTEAPEVNYFLAEALLNLTRPEEALKAYRDFLKSAPRNDPRYNVAETRLEELQKAVITDIVRQKSRDAREALRKKNWDEAIRLYGEVHGLAPEDVEAVYYRGKAWLGKGDYLNAYLAMLDYLKVEPSGRRSSDAKRQARSLEKLYRESIEAAELNQQGRAAFDREDYDQALEYFNLAVTNGPLNSDAYYNRAETYLKMGESTQNDHEFEFALKDYAVVATLEPESRIVLIGEGLCYYYLRQYDRALEKGEQAIRQLPADWRGFNLVGLVHLGEKDYKRASRVYDRGLKIGREVVILNINRALAHEGLGEYEEALARLETAASLKATESDLSAIDRIAKRVSDSMDEE